jgi:DNA helicase IV
VSAIVDRALADVLPECPECRSELTYRSSKNAEWLCEACDKSYATNEVLSPAAAVLVDDLRRHVTAQVVQPEGDEAPLLRTFGHVVVDEAQDLSPMQWRALARRCPAGSMTIVGDLGQASGHWAPRSWREVIDLVPAPRASVVELTVNYRTPHEVMELAARVLSVARPDLTPARSVRDAGVSPRFVRVDRSDLVGGAIAAAATEVAELPEGEGKVALIVPERLLAPVTAALDLRPELAGAGGDVLEAPVSALILDDAKGLEFDAVVVVDPVTIADEHPHGLGALYVALTRTTTRLAVVHTGELPEPLLKSA